MTDQKQNERYPQIGVRFPPKDMQRLREHAEEHYAGSISTMVKVAVKRLIEKETNGVTTAEQQTVAA